MLLLLDPVRLARRTRNGTIAKGFSPIPTANETGATTAASSEITLKRCAAVTQFRYQSIRWQSLQNPTQQPCGRPAARVTAFFFLFFLLIRCFLAALERSGLNKLPKTRARSNGKLASQNTNNTPHAARNASNTGRQGGTSVRHAENAPGPGTPPRRDKRQTVADVSHTQNNAAKHTSRGHVIVLAASAVHYELCPWRDRFPPFLLYRDYGCKRRHTVHTNAQKSCC